MNKSKPSSKNPKFSDFRPINVPLTPLRVAIAEHQKAGVEEMPLEALLLLIHKVIKENKNE